MKRNSHPEVFSVIVFAFLLSDDITNILNDMLLNILTCNCLFLDSPGTFKDVVNLKIVMGTFEENVLAILSICL